MPIANQISIPKIYFIILGIDTLLVLKTIFAIFNANATAKRTSACFFVFIQGVTRNKKNNAYKNQYGAIGLINNVRIILPF